MNDNNKGQRMKKKIRVFFENRAASAGAGTYIFAILIMFVGVVLGIVFDKYYTVFYNAQSIKETMKDACIYVMTSNWDEIFYSVREGYSGAYNINGSDLLDSERVYQIMQNDLGTIKYGNRYIRYEDNNINQVIYSYYNIRMDVNNTGFKNKSSKYNVDLSLTYETEINILGIHFPMMFELYNKASWEPKF